MGKSIEMECNNCHYSFAAHLGIGFRFPQVYQNTINAAKEGKFGEIVQSFLLEHPDGALNCNIVLLQCTSCDELDKGRDLSMYIPKDKPAAHDGIWSVAFPYKNASYVLGHRDGLFCPSPASLFLYSDDTRYLLLIPAATGFLSPAGLLFPGPALP